MTDSIAIAQLAVFVVFLFPCLFCLIRHGRPGILGWIYLVTLSILRIVSSSISIHEAATHGGSATMVLGSVGLSPLLLAAAGVLHESRTARNPYLNKQTEWARVAYFHALVSGALALVIVGIINLENNKNVSTMKIILRIGAAIVGICWLVLLALTLFSLGSGRAADAPAGRDGTLLLYGVATAVPFVGLRMVYGVTALVLYTTDPTSSFLTSQPVDICLAVVPEMVVVALLCGVGIATRNLVRKAREIPAPAYGPVDGEVGGAWRERK